MSDYVLSQYDDALRRILSEGVEKPDRTGVGSLSIAGMQCRYPLGERFPLLSRRRVWPKAVFAELVWFLSGSTNTNDLNRLGAKFWDPWKDRKFEEEWGYPDGDLGPIYGFQLRHFGGTYKNVDHNPGFDQLAYMVGEFQKNPYSRRIMFDLWNPNDLHRMRLPPCHFHFQILLDGKGGLTGILTQRSCDFPVGVPANIQFYSALTMMFAQQFGCQPREFVHNTNDSHVYLNQVDAVKKYLDSPVVESPTLKINKAKDMFSYSPDDFEIAGYRPGPKVDFEVNV